MSVIHYNDVMMSSLASQITRLTIVVSTVYSRADKKKHQRSASLAFVWGIHQWPVNSPHKGPVTRKIFPFDDVIMFPIPVNKPLITFHYGNSGKGFTFILMIIHYHVRGNQRECSMLFFIVEVIYCGHNVWTYGSVTNLYLSSVVNSF